jgi:hypothetical protein
MVSHAKASAPFTSRKHRDWCVFPLWLGLQWTRSASGNLTTPTATIAAEDKFIAFFICFACSFWFSYQEPKSICIIKPA